MAWIPETSLRSLSAVNPRSVWKLNISVPVASPQPAICFFGGGHFIWGNLQGRIGHMWYRWWWWGECLLDQAFDSTAMYTGIIIWGMNMFSQRPGENMTCWLRGNLFSVPYFIWELATQNASPIDAPYVGQSLNTKIGSSKGYELWHSGALFVYDSTSVSLLAYTGSASDGFWWDTLSSPLPLVFMASNLPHATDSYKTVYLSLWVHSPTILAGVYSAVSQGKNLEIPLGLSDVSVVLDSDFTLAYILLLCSASGNGGRVKRLWTLFFVNESCIQLQWCFLYWCVGVCWDCPSTSIGWRTSIHSDLCSISYPLLS